MFGADGREAIYIELGDMRGLIVKKKRISVSYIV